MLRITSDLTGGEQAIKLEGDLSGPWVSELASFWTSAATHSDGPILVDLSDVFHVDEPGRELLTLMYRAGVRFVTRGFVMPEVLREISESIEGGQRS